MRKFETEQVAKTEGDHTEGLKELDVAAIDDPVLVNTVQERLDNLNELTSDKDLGRLGAKTAVPEEEPEGSTPEPEDGSEPEGIGQAEPKKEPDGSTPEAETKKDDIPDAYVRAAIHQGWDQEVVDDLIENNPDLAKKTLEALYLSTNNASREWSELGRAKIDAERAKVAPITTEAVAQEDPKTAALVAKLRKEYVDDPLIEVVIADLEKKPKPQPVQQAQVSQQQLGYETATARADAAANVAIDQRINTFFSANTLKPYEKFYGKLELGQIPEDLSNGQQHNRVAVLQEAEFIMAGHAMRNQKIEVEAALEKAHFIVTEPIRQQVIRDGLKATATKRKNSMTFKPSDSKRSNTGTESSKPRNRREVEFNVQQKLDSIHNR